MIKKITFSLFFLLNFAFLTCNAQAISGTILDSISQKPVPFTTIQWSIDKGLITNEEGYFKITSDNTIKPTDSISISSMGYETLMKTFIEFKDSIIYLTPKAISLSNVIVSNKQYTADEIIDLVNENLEKNYTTDITKKRVFYRERNYQNLNKAKYSDFESTITAFNTTFLDSVIKIIPKSDEHYTEALFDFYENQNDKSQKINLIKASELYDKNSDMDLNKLEDKFNKIIKENVKTTSYFKVKSGIFGSKIETEDIFGTSVDSTDVVALNKKIEDEKKRKENRQKYFAEHIKNKVSKTLENLFFNNKTDLNFITKARKYNYTLEEFSYLNDEPVYVINFNSKGSADYQGKLYINADDFAVVRADYENTKSIKTFNLLGISMNQYLSKGKIIFYKGENNSYNLRYLEKEEGTSVGVNRPLKIIEKNKVVKGKNKQNELSLKMDLGLTSTDKFEIVIFNTTNTNSAEFDSFNESNKISPVYMPKYDPEFWKGHTIIEPNAAIREFTSKEIE